MALDALPLLFLFMFHIIPRMDPRGQAYERMGSLYTGFVILFTIFIVAMTWSSELTVFGILPESGSPIGAATSIAVGVGLILLGNYMPKIKRNYTFGARTHGHWMTMTTGASRTASAASRACWPELRSLARAHSRSSTEISRSGFDGRGPGCRHRDVPLQLPRVSQREQAASHTLRHPLHFAPSTPLRPN